MRSCWSERKDCPRLEHNPRRVDPSGTEEDTQDLRTLGYANCGDSIICDQRDTCTYSAYHTRNRTVDLNMKSNRVCLLEWARLVRLERYIGSSHCMHGLAPASPPLSP